MTYLVSQLWFCLLLAWMLGNIVGWLLRGGCTAHIKRLEKNWRERYLTLEEEKENYVAQINKLKLAGNETDRLMEQLAKYQEIERLNTQLRSQVKDVEIIVKTMRSDLHAKTQALAKCQNVLGASKKVIYVKDETLRKLASQLKIEKQQLNRSEQRLSECDSQMNKQLEMLNVELDEAKQEFEVYKVKYDECNQQSTAVAEQLENSQRKQDELMHECERANIDLAKSNAALAEQNESVEMLTATVKIRDEMVEYYEKQLKESSDEKAVLSNKLEGLANEFAKVATAMMKVKSERAVENNRFQEERENITLKFKALEKELTETNKQLEQKEQALKDLQEKTVIKQSNTKVHQLERQLKHMRKKLKMASYIGDRDAIFLTENQDIFNEVEPDTRLLGLCCEIENIRGIGSGHGERLRKLGIRNNHDLLRHTLSTQDVKRMAQKIACKSEDILLWKKMADFLRIKGVNAEFAQLLALSRLNSVEEVALSNAMQLLDKMKAARKKERRIRHLPELEDINKWIHEAKNIVVMNGGKDKNSNLPS